MHARSSSVGGCEGTLKIEWEGVSDAHVEKDSRWTVITIMFYPDPLPVPERSLLFPDRRRDVVDPPFSVDPRRYSVRVTHEGKLESLTWNGNLVRFEFTRGGAERAEEVRSKIAALYPRVRNDQLEGQKYLANIMSKHGPPLLRDVHEHYGRLVCECSRFMNISLWTNRKERKRPRGREPSATHFLTCIRDYSASTKG